MLRLFNRKQKINAASVISLFYDKTYALVK